MKNLLCKLTSRKFLVSLISMAAGIALLCGADADTVAKLSGAAMTALSALIYCVIEGRIDEATAKQTAQAAKDAADALGVGETVRSVIVAAGDALCAAAEQDGNE